jgi:hypothetical protein
MELKLHDPNDKEIIRALFRNGGSIELMKPKGKGWDAFQAAFGIMCEELGIADKPNVVEVSFVPKMRDGVDGATDNVSADPILVELKVKAPFEVLSTFAHEMFHVRNLVTGASEVRDGKLMYRGQPIQKSSNPLEEVLRPDELEAYEGMHPLTLKVLGRLPADLAEVYTDSYKAMLPPPTLPEFYLEERELLKAKIKEAKEAA